MTQWALSGDGRRVAFDSFATNLVEGFHLDPFIANIFVRTLPAH